MGRHKINDGLTKYQRYHLKNKDKRNSYSKKYHEDNRGNILARKLAYDKKRRIEVKHNPLVYLIVNENYVGVTECIKFRIQKHRANNKDVSEVEILGQFDKREYALLLEKQLHQEGYSGAHKFNTYK
jgi:hypothetical protein